MRNLATIQRIIDIKPIPNADAIEVAQILGWHVVIKRNEFKVNDLCVYVEIDSLLPHWPEFEFLASSNYRIRTVRLRGQVSQGICFPLSILEGKKFKDDTRENPKYELYEGYDVTGLLQIEKYEPAIPACLSGLAIGYFPSFIPTTDETRIQSMPEILTKYKWQRFYVTEKCDGSSCTIFIKDNNFGVCSSGLQLAEDDKNSFWKVVKQNNIEEKIRSLDMNIALQGELVGEGIRGNKLGIKGHDIYFFTAFDIDEYKFMDGPDLLSMLMTLGLKMVPIIDANYKLPLTVDELVAFVQRKSEINPNVWIEGGVFRPHIEIIDTEIKLLHANRLSFKCINPNFLLKYNE